MRRPIILGILPVLEKISSLGRECLFTFLLLPFAEFLQVSSFQILQLEQWHKHIPPDFTDFGLEVRHLLTFLLEKR